MKPFGELTEEEGARVCSFLGFCRGGGLLSLEDLLGVAISAGVGMFCALFLDMAVYVTALQNNS